MAKTIKLLTSPSPGTVVKPMYVYDEGQEEKLQALREVSLLFTLFATAVAIDSPVNAPPPFFCFLLQYAYSLHLPDDDPYAQWERRWLDMPDTMPRYLRAAKWKLDDARKRIKGTIEWRREFQPELIPPDEVKIEAATGKMWVLLSVRARPIIRKRNHEIDSVRDG